MDFRIADTFTDSLARLTGEEQKAGHRLAKSRDKGFWSVRVNQDIQLIVHRTRARDHLLVTGVIPASEFLQDLGA